MNAVHYPIALDHDRNLSAEIGLLLSAYAIIDLFIFHIYSVVSSQDKDTASVILGKVNGNGQRIDLIRELLKASSRIDKEAELKLIDGIEKATKVRNQYAHAIYSQVSASQTGWRMSCGSVMEQSAKRRSKTSAWQAFKKTVSLCAALLNHYFISAASLSPTIEFERIASDA